MRRGGLYLRHVDREVGDLRVRPSIDIGNAQDAAQLEQLQQANPVRAGNKLRLSSKSERLSFVDLFTGAGGLALGFLMAKYRGRDFLLHAVGECDHSCIETVRGNYKRMARLGAYRGRFPEKFDTVDLSQVRYDPQILSSCSDGLDVLVGGPPCQGFSMANRNSWYASNPNNSLMGAFLRYVKRLRPRVFLIENVQGLLWTAGLPTAGSPTAADYVVETARNHGYLVFPKLLDAAWFGVPQHRTRLYIMGIHRDLGYTVDDFGEWGPWPRPTHGPGLRPFVTVQDAIGDLPAVANGHFSERTIYEECEEHADRFLRYARRYAPSGYIMDHVVSKQAEYVIDRYRNVPPGGNWRDIKHLLTNYAGVGRTHSNVYRRLQWETPSVTVGHYRKSMLIHPEQDRGLSLREAARLQGFPDWFRFWGSDSGRAQAGLSRKQQQLGNAVSPIVARSIARSILAL